MNQFTSITNTTDVEDNEWWKSLSDETFTLCFPIPRYQISELKIEIAKVNPSLEEQTLLACVWMLGNTQELEVTLKLFNVTHKMLRTCLENLKETCNKYVLWPPVEEAEEIEEAFYAQHNIHGIIGVIGTIFVHVHDPNECNETTVLQLVTDDRMVVRDLCIGYSGKMAADEVVRASPLFKKLTDTDSYIVQKKWHLCGGDEHPRIPTLINALDNPSEADKLENLQYFFMQTMLKIENQFPRISAVDELTPEYAKLVLSACCLLYNFVKIKNLDVLNERRKRGNRICCIL